MRTPDFFQSTPLADLRVLRAPEVRRLVGLSATSIRDLERKGRFPARVALSSNSVGYFEVEVRQFLADRAMYGCVEALGARAPAQVPTPKPRGRKSAGRV